MRRRGPGEGGHPIFPASDRRSPHDRYKIERCDTPPRSHRFFFARFLFLPGAAAGAAKSASKPPPFCDLIDRQRRRQAVAPYPRPGLARPLSHYPHDRPTHMERMMNFARTLTDAGPGPAAPARPTARAFARLRIVSIIAAGATLVALLGSADAAQTPESFADLAAKVSPAVVNVSSKHKVARAENSAPDVPDLPKGS